ncbi:MAG TPA: SAF domain-containing protein [Acidimicrobiales bacterium]|nr:SAF domain-containing protein [Acidimicrobiales bacterium]
MRRLRRRWRRSGFTYWLLAGTLAAATGVFVAGRLHDAEAAAARYGGLRRVPVATRSLRIGSVVRAGDLTTRAVPRQFLPSGPVATRPLGRTVVVPIVRGEVLLAVKLAPDGLRGVAALLFDRERALAVPTGPGTPPLEVGDAVDVLATTPEDAATTVVAHGARVVGVDERAVIVAIEAVDAPGVAAALAAATVTLALAAP